MDNLLNKKRSAMTVAVSIVIGFLLSTFVALILEKFSYGVFIYQSVQPLLFIGVSLFFAYKYGNGVKNTLFVKGFKPKYLIYVLVLFFGLFFGLGYINQTVFSSVEASFNISINNFGDYLLYALTLAVAPATGEELLFRGLALFAITAYLDNNGQNGYGIKNDLIISCVIGLTFALYHKSLSQLFYQFFYGFSLTLIVIRSGSIFPAIIMHLLNNLVIITVYYINPNLTLFNIPLCIVGVIVFMLSAFILVFEGRKNVGVKINYSNVLPYFALAGGFSLVMLLMFI